MANVPGMIPDVEISALQQLYESGLYVAAWKRMQEFPPPAEWRQPKALIIAGRILGNVESRKAGRTLHNKAWRLDRRDPDSAYYRAFSMMERLGALRALRFVEQLPEYEALTDEQRANFLSVRANLLSVFRDFSQAGPLIDEAVRLDGGRPWVWVEKAGMLQRADDYPGALAAASQALKLKPFYRPAVQIAAALLGLLGRDDEAFTLLREAAGRIESASVVAQLAALLVEHERHEEAIIEWKRYRELAVAIEPEMLEWWHSRMADVHYELGNLIAAADHARLSKNGFHEKIAGRLASPPAEGRVVRLEVPFVRQHAMTCAPATLAALGGHWKAAVDHLALAAEICYDGTQSHRERTWARNNGFIAREFSVTWDASVALLDRGIPFAVCTIETRSAHLQAVIGYDSVRRTLRIRDPYLKHPGEALGAEWLEDYAFCGPRGLVIVPNAEAARLDGLMLPDAELYDLLHTVESSVFVHERARAVDALAALETLAPEHRVTFEARRELAGYDGNQQRMLEATEGLLKLFPASRNLQWGRYSLLRDLARNEERRALLGEMARAEKAEPFFWRELADDLRCDARKLQVARRWILRALHFQPTDPELLHTAAGILWDERRFEDAHRLYRLAACQRDKVEFFQRSWFIAARHLRLQDEVLSVFAGRAENDGARSSLPGRGLFSALTWVQRDTEGLAALDAAIALRPADGDLLCFAAEAFARYGNHERASELLANAEGKCARIVWLRTAATVADYRSDLASALRLTQAAILETPLDSGLHATVARLLAGMAGYDAALAHLKEQIERFPHHLGLRQIYIGWCRDKGAAAAESPLREFIGIEPENVWALREIALVLTELNRFDEALVFSGKAIEIAPHEESSHGIHAHVLLRAGRPAEAAESARTAIRLSVDYTSAYGTLIESAASFDGKREGLSFILGELERQVVFGDALVQYVHHAFGILEKAALLANLRAAHAARPDLWQAWSVLIGALNDSQLSAEALPIAKDAVERFPLQSRLWFDLARIHRACRDFSGEVDALRQALALAPASGQISRELSEALQRVENYAGARDVLEKAIAAAPLDPINYGVLADLLWRRNRDAQAADLLMRAVRLSPAYTWAWSNLSQMLPPDDKRPLDLARELTQTRAGETASWLRLAEMLPATAFEQRLDAVQRALALNARDLDIHDFHAFLLAEAGRYDDALAACRPGVFGDSPPRELRGRAAWVLARRGNVTSAMEAIEALARAEPDYYWAWERLAEWSSQLGDHEAEKRAAEMMARLNPRSAIPLGYIADAMLKLGDRDGALTVLKRAFALDPSYGYAGFTVFGEALKRRDFAGAEAMLAQLRTHLPGADTTAAEVQLAASTRKKDLALAGFSKVLRAKEGDASGVFAAAAAIIEAGWGRDLEKLIWQEREDPTLCPASGTVWVRSFVQCDAWSCRDKLCTLDTSLPFAKAALREFAVACGEKNKPEYLAQLLKTKIEWFIEDGEGWGNVGFALVSCGRHERASEWFANWRERKEVLPWMLVNVAVTFENRGKHDEAAEVSMHALSMRRDHTAPNHVLRVACHAAINGDCGGARAALQEVEFGRMDPDLRARWSLVDGVCKVSDALPAARRRIYDQWRDGWVKEYGYGRGSRVLDAVFDRADEEAANLAGVKRKRPPRRIIQAGSGGNAFDPAMLIPIGILIALALSRCAQNH